jgi:hypothetical protein
MATRHMGIETYLSVCAIYRDEAEYLREWIEFHRLVGVERFFLYNNRSTDAHEQVLAPYLEDGSVELRDWPVFPGQVAAYDHCLETHRDTTRWIAFIDTDEFLFSPTGKSLREILAELEPWPGVGVNRLRFGTSGHRTKPNGLVIENYLLRALPLRYLIKTIADPSRTVRCLTAHTFEYTDGWAVDENQRPLDPNREAPGLSDGAGRAYTESFTVARLRINHYLTKSEAEHRTRSQRRQADTGEPRRNPAVKLSNFARERDEAILHYVPELRKRMSKLPPIGARLG